MKTKNILVLVIIGIIILVGLYVWKGRIPLQNTPNDQVQNTDTASTKTFSLPDYKVSFDYPSHYLILDREAGTPQSPQHAAVLVEDNQTNRDILAGKTPEVGEGPTSITVDMFQNPKKLGAEAWVQENTNWIMSDKKKGSVTVAGKQGFVYYWDGLYAGKSAVVTTDTHAYIFSVTWITAEDQMLKDFESILNSVKFSN